MECLKMNKRRQGFVCCFSQKQIWINDTELRKRWLKHRLGICCFGKHSRGKWSNVPHWSAPSPQQSHWKAGRQAGKWAGTSAENQSKGLTFLPLQKNCKAVGHIIDFRSWPLCYYLVLQENFGAKLITILSLFTRLGQWGWGREWTDWTIAHLFTVCVSLQGHGF